MATDRRDRGWRGLLTAVALAALMAVPGVGAAAADVATAGDTTPETAPAASAEGGAETHRAARERRVVRALAAGLDTSEALDSLRREGAAPDRSPLPSTDAAGGELLRSALEDLAVRAPVAHAGQHDLTQAATSRDPQERDGGDGRVGGDAAWSRFLAADLLVRDAFTDARRRLLDTGLSGEMLFRLDEAEARYEATVGAVRRSGPEGAARAAGELVRSPAPAILGVGGLPFRRPELAPRPPRTTPTVRPVYLDPADPAPTAADRAGSPSAPLAAEIVERARELDYDAVRIYESVRNGIATELYAGSQRGALGTLRAVAGNDVDQASLLVALLRAASVPARFVHGVVELPVEGYAADLGVAPVDVPRALARAGVAHRPVVRGGRVAAVEVEHTWVAARVPYGNYRGTLVDPSAPAWVPLAPAVKGHALERPTGVLTRAGLTSEEALDHFLTEPRPEEPLAWLRRRVEEWLAVEEPGETYAGQLGARAVRPLALGLLPSTLPAPVVAVTGESAVLSGEHLPTLGVVVRDGDGRQLLEHTLPLHRVAGRRLTLSSTPATVDDDRVVHLWGGLDSVPAYLVRLRPRLRLDGRPLAVGEGDSGMGARQSVELTLAGPWGAQIVRRQRIAGAYQAVVVGAGTAGSVAPGAAGLDPAAEPDPADGEGLAARLLFALGAGYGERWSAAEDEIADLLDLALVRPWPSVAVVTDEVEVTEAGGLPLDLAWHGVTLDALVRAAEPLARPGSSAGGEAGASAPSESGPEREWMRLAALQGSALEHRVFGNLFLTEAVSADLGLALARQGGMEILRLDAANLAVELPRLADHPEVVLADVERRVDLGWVVEIPLLRISVDAWTGSVWRAEDPATGSAGYFIAGGLAGGATTEAPSSWVLELLAQALAAPYSSAPNTDAGGGARVAKVVETDRQRGTVGQRLNKRLTVRVTDATGRPVQGASVTFRVWSGGGSLLDEEGGRTGILLTTTDRLGLASAPFAPGTDTGEDPVYVADPAGIYPSRAGANLVEAVATSRGGDLVLDEPFVTYGFPASAHALRRTDSAETLFQISSPGLWSDTLRLAVEDRYGNPISNEALYLTAAVGASDESCTNPPQEPILPGAVFDPDFCSDPMPRLGDCGSPEKTVLTRSGGAAAGFIPGDSAVSTYTVRVDHAVLDPLAFTYSPVYSQASSGRCDPLERFAIRARQSFNAEGDLINAAEVGSTFGRPLELQLFYWRPDQASLPQSDGSFEVEELAQGSWAVTQADRVEVTVDNGGAGTDPAWDATRQAYRSAIRVGPAPARNRVAARVEGLRYLVGDTLMTWPEPLVRTVSAVWGVDLAILRATPEPIPLTDEGRTAEEVTLTYGVAPAEYRASSAEILLFETGREVATAVGSSRSAGGTATTQRGFTFDRDHRYTAQLVLNRGSSSDVRSPAFELPLTQRLFRDVSPSVVVSQEVDLVNQRACGQTDLFRFGVNRAATVSLVLRGVERRPDGTTVEDGSELTLIDGRALAEGGHEEPVSPGDVPPGEYRYVLTGTAADGTTETRRGFVRSLYRERDALPVGHVMVDGVDLFDGHLVLSRTDLDIPGRGLPLAFTRTFSSSSAGEPGPVGAGWTHNWDSRVVATPCGELIVLGGDGSGARFVDDGEGGLRPLRGHHGSLVVDEETLGLDYYSRAGVRYHYTPGGEGWDLAFVEDPSGNRTTLTYEDGAGAPGARRLAAVEDEAGRRLRFTWEVLATVRGPAEVIVAVEGPGGLRVDLDYDEWGHAVRAAREPHADGSPSRVESYTWELRPERAYDDLHVLTAVRDEVGGGVTRYDWELGSIGVQGNLAVPRAFVTRVTRPEGGEVGFAYEPAALASRETATVGVGVTDPRGYTTSYTLNQYGAPVAIEDPEGGLTRTEWVPGRALMAARIDPNGVRTDYSYDEHGNLLTESVEVTDFDGASQRLTRTRTFHPPEAFEPPFVKNRVATSTDRTGATTRFEYDGAGRLVRREIDVRQAAGGSRRVVSSRTWTAAGDLASETDPRGHTTRYTYDAYGYPATVTDPLGGVTARTWDVRGRLVAVTDPLGRETGYDYDTLGRRVETRLPAVAGESDGPVEEVRYDDSARTVTRVDALGRESRDSFDLEGRVVERRNAAGARQVLSYDAAGLKVIESTWHDAATPRHDHTFTYDRAGRRVRQAQPLGRVTETDYDAAGNVVRETLSNAGNPGFAPRVVEHDYDELGRRVESRRLTGGGAVVTRTRYDGEGRPVEVVDPLGRSTFAEYDELGREIVRSEPPWRPGQRRVTTFVYDDAGNLVEERLDNDPEPRVRTSSYDALGRRVSRTDGTGGVTHFDYDAVGNLVRRIDPRLDVVTYGYDARDRRVSETVHLDRVSQPARRVETRYGHDAVGNRTSETWPNGNRVTHVYDALDRLVESRDSLGLLLRYAYDARGNRVAEVDGEGRRTETAFDALDRAVERRAPLGRVTAWTWDVVGNRLSETDPRGFETRFTYDRLDRLVEETDPLGATTLSTYDLVGNLLSRTDRRGFTTRFEYDSLDRWVRTVDPAPLSSETTRTYDAAGRVLTETDRRGIVTETAYDAEGRPTEVRRAGVLLEGRAYDAAGNLRFLTDANGHTTGYEYDERGLRLAENRPLGAITRWTYDDVGDLVEERDPEGRVTTRVFDLRRRPVAETDPAGATTAWSYDLVGNRLSERRPEGNTWGYAYDAADRLSAVTDPLGEETAYGYDPGDHLLTQTDANGHTTRFEYDALGRRTAQVYPDGEREETGYDAEGNRALRVDAAGQETAYTHDPLGRETLRTYGSPLTPLGDDLQSIATVRDANGNPLTVTETYSGATGTRVTERAWDAFDRLESEVDPEGQYLAYTYDANGNRLSLTDPDGEVTRYAYDALNRLTAVTSGAGITEYAWLKDGRLTEVSYPNGTRARHAYDAAGRTATLESTQGSTLVSRFTYTYDLNGNRRSQVEARGADPAETTTYSYDPADRLLEVTYPDSTVSYGYDPVGNRQAEVREDPAGTVLADKTYLYDDRDRLLSLTDALDPDGVTTFTYDAAGNRRSSTPAVGEPKTYLYGVRNRLVEVRKAGILLESYRYDHRGLRVRRAGPEGVVHAVYDDTSLLVETDPAGNTLRKYDYGPDRLLSLAESTGERRFYLFDALGSVTDLVSPSGSVEARYVYDAWGNLRRDLGSSENPFAFTGHRLDRPTGLYYAKARYYDPELGLFLTEDPFQGEVDNPPSLHRYLYAYQNPTVYVDPTGERGVTPDQFLSDIERYERLQAQSAELAGQLQRASEAGDLRSMRELGRQSLALRRQLNRARGRVEAGEEFFSDVLVVLEGVEGSEARLTTLTNFLLLPENRTGRHDEAVRLATAILGPLECRSALCQRLPQLTEGEMKILDFMESFAGQSALLGLFEIGALSLVDDAVRAPSLADDSVRLASAGDEPARLAQVEGRAGTTQAKPSSGSLKNRSGDLDEAAHAARTQPYGAPAKMANEARSKFPTGESQLRHIFRDAPGHLTDTQANRRLLQQVADDATTTLGTDRFGNVWSARTLEDGTQVWVQVRNGVIQNGGVNTTPRPFDPQFGLSGGGG